MILKNENCIVRDDKNASIDCLVLFAKCHCIDINMTNELGDLQNPFYRCEQCTFNSEGICLIKMHILKNGSQKQIGDLHNNLIPLTKKLKKQGGKTDELNS